MQDKKIPSSWKEVSLRTYLKIADLQVDEQEEFQALYIIEAYTGIPLVELKRMPLTELHAISSKLAFVSTPIPEEPIESFTISGETFGVTQSLLLEQAQDYFALEAILSEAQENSFKALPKLLAVVCKKPGESLDEIDINKRSELFLDLMDVQTANSLRVFFYSCGMLFQLNSLFYSNREAIWEQKVSEVENSINKLDGTTLYSKWLKMTLQRFLRYYIHVWKTYSSGVPLNNRESNFKTTWLRWNKRKKVRESMGIKPKSSH